MMHVRLRSARLSLLIALAAAPTAAFSNDDAARLEFFEKRIRPILVGHCYTCHSANTNSRGGLRVDDINGLLNGGEHGPAILPGKPEESLLILAVRHTEGQRKMPPEKKLDEAQIADLGRWIEDGAAWPTESDWTPAAPGPEYVRLRSEHWAWQPLQDPAIPVVVNEFWPRNTIDRFLLSRLEREGLEPVSDADKITLIRRITFDLTGLPPTPGEIQAFMADDSVQAFERVVDRLLDSPAFGERWGRHWLDVARYGESTGSARNLPYPHAWRYRDYVIAAFNADKPFDQFLKEQIAGDLLPANSPAERIEHLIATGFLALGVKDVNQRFKVRYIMDNIDEQIDTVSRAVLGLTASCARCHDHKFDPIPQTDYYALAGIFHSTDLCAGLRSKMGGGGLDYYDTDLLLLLGPADAPSADVAVQTSMRQRELAAAQAALKALQDEKKEAGEDSEERKKQLQAARQKVNQARNALAALSDPALQGPVAMGVRDAAFIGDTEIRIRGEAERLGPRVSRGFLSLFDVPNVPKFDSQHSGRLELAQWLTSPQNPLTPRVMVNRIWKHLFGAGLVRSVDNFGVTGDKPSHPELLDHLALRFQRDGWSVKSMIRSLVLTRAYQLSAAATENYLTVDPANRLVWRHSSRRLDAEEIRDAMLAAVGKLEREPFLGSPIQAFQVIELANNGKPALDLLESAAKSHRRSVYLPLLRTLVPAGLDVFDFADQGMVTGQRSTTTVAPQALYLLNDAFVRRQSRDLRERLQKVEPTEADRIRTAYTLVLNRSPSAEEVAQAQHYLAEYAALVEAARQPPSALQATNAAVNATPAEDSHSVDPQAAAWASFCQALFASAEFRYLK